MKQHTKRKAVAVSLLLCTAACAVFFWGRQAGWFHKTQDGLPAAPASVSANISNEDFTLLTKNEADIHCGTLQLVNSKTPYQFIDNNDLQDVINNRKGTYQVKDHTVQLAREALAPFDQMMSDFEKAKGKSDVIAVSGYRSHDLQNQLYEEKKAAAGQAEADRWVAHPGYSEHHTGYAMDLSIYYKNGSSGNYNGSGKYAWIAENAWRYGFILRYTAEKEAITGIAEEPWHFRYVGKAHAAAIRDKGMCLEEYTDFLKNYTAGGEHLIVKDADGKSYEIYYVKAEGKKPQIPVPKDGNYSISGNNTDGFIVTVSK